MNPFVSAIKSFGIGVVAKPKDMGSSFIEVYPEEAFPTVDGELNYNPNISIDIGVDSDGNRYEVKTNIDVTITAEWLPASSNRVTPPDMQRGELVEIFRLSDTDTYFWRSLGLRDNLRRLETVIYAFSANPKPNSKLDMNSCYFFEISTHKKLVTFRTSNVNGEVTIYTFQLNPGEGIAGLTDDLGSYFEINTLEKMITLKNADTSEVVIDKDIIRAKNRTGSRVILDGSTINAEADSLIGIKCGASEIRLTPAEITLTSPRINHKRS